MSFDENLYYDGAELLSKKDINGLTPEIFICTSNKTAGKTTYFSRLCVNKYKQKQSKFMLVYRFKDELDECANKFFKDINTLFFPYDEMASERRSNGTYHELFLSGKPCGYAAALNNVDRIKKMSHLFSDTDRMFFDEFQSETNHYAPNEVNKFRALHTAVARGQGKFTRYVPVYMCANPVTILNPYYVAMGITDRLKIDTHFLRGDGFVIEQGHNENAAKAQQESAFNRAFGSDNYSAYQAQGIYLNDSMAFVETVKGNPRYIATVKYKGIDYGLKEYREQGIIYCDNKPDLTYPLKISVTTADHNVNYVMLQYYRPFIESLRYFFDKGCFRFKNLQCKDTVIKLLSY